MCYYHVTCVYSRYNARSDWAILRHYSPVLLMGRLRACKIKQKVRKTHAINYLLTLNVLSLRENVGPRPFREERPSYCSVNTARSLVKTSLLFNK